MTVDLRMLVPAAAGWATAAILIGIPVAQLPVSIVLWLAAAAAVVVSLKLRWVAVVALALVACACCATSVAFSAPSRTPDALTEPADSGRRVSVTLVATEPIVPGARSWEAQLVSVDDSVINVPVVVFGGTPAERADIGDVLSTTATIAATDPGDDRAYLVFPDGDVTLASTAPATSAWANHLRTGFRDAAATLPGAGGQLLAGLAIGDTTLVDDELTGAMNTSSLSHLTAVSGANCAIVIGLVMLVGGALGLPRVVRVAVSLLVLVAFVILVTPEPSVLRASVMAGIVLVLLASGRPVSGPPVLALAVLALLIIDPWLARTYGFALSVLATSGLLLLAGPMAAVLRPWIPRWLALVIAVPTAAQLTCQPVIILLDPSIPTYGVIANVLAAPAAPVATIVGLAACLTLAVAPPLGQALCLLAWVPSAWIAAVAQFFESQPAARLPWPAGLGGVALLAAVSSIAVVVIVGRGRWRRWAAFGLAAVVVVFLGSLGLGRLLDVSGRPAHWQIAACDIGQGDAVVVRSAGAVALIDTGPDPRLLDACLTDLGIGRVDLLVLTHFDLDHVGGSSAVVGRADTVLAGPRGSDDDDRLLAEFTSAGAQVISASRGDSGVLGEHRWQVLWPPARGAPEPGNDASVVMSFSGVGECTHGCLSALFPGDLGEESQQRLLELGPLDPVDVVNVAHHGSGDQSPEMYERAAATVGIIGVGVDNGYGHPTAATLQLLAASGTGVLRTDLHGLVLVAPGDSPGSVVGWRQRPG